MRPGTKLGGRVDTASGDYVRVIGPVNDWRCDVPVYHYHLKRGDRHASFWLSSDCPLETVADTVRGVWESLA